MKRADDDLLRTLIDHLPDLIYVKDLSGSGHGAGAGSA